MILLGNADLATGVEAMKLGAVDVLAAGRSRRSPPPCARQLTATAASARANAWLPGARRAVVGARAQVLEHVGSRAALNKQIAARLNIAEQTVSKQHRGRVMEKIPGQELGAQS